MFGNNYSYGNRLFEVLEVIESGKFDEDGVDRLFCSLFNFEPLLYQKMHFYENK